jgi:hypothetical protein
MKLTNFFRAIIIGAFICLVTPFSSKALYTANSSITVRDTTGDAQVYSKLVTRLSEIQSMDKNNLTTGEKKNLRNELKDMKKAAEGLDSKVYISVGAIIIIILLLILILR